MSKLLTNFMLLWTMCDLPGFTLCFPGPRHRNVHCLITFYRLYCFKLFCLLQNRLFSMSLLTREMDCTGKFNAKVKADLILQVKYSGDSVKSFYCEVIQDCMTLHCQSKISEKFEFKINEIFKY